MSPGRITSGRLLLAAACVTALLTWLLARGVALDTTHPALAGLVLVLFAVTTLMLAASALTAVMGMARQGSAGKLADPTPERCAVLWLVCGEPPEPLAARIGDLLAGLRRTGQARDCDVFVLSDTQAGDALAAEQAALAGIMGHIRYRHRALPDGRKPGNLQDWLDAQGEGYETFLILDADSGFSAARLAQMRARMAAIPELGLLQAAIRLRPAQSRFGGMQRLSARLSGPVFARGLSLISGDAGNFWGHNALIRRRAFAEISPLPQLEGRAPFGGPVLSHDFIEAAFLRRRGWHVEICPDSRGSFEDAPDTLAAHLRRDRRWAQGNLQHLRLIAESGLHPTSRLHLAAGILSYLMAPLWLLMVLVIGSGAVHASAAVLWPLLGVLLLLLAPKIVGVLAQHRALARPARRRVLLRALWGELCLTTLFAPISMFRRTGFIVSILAGRSTDWVPSGQTVAQAGMTGRSEAAGGVAIILAVAVPQWVIAGAAPALLAGVLVLPVALPLLLAPLLWPWFDAPRAPDAVAQYYDQSTRRFLAMGGSGAALAIHRPLWAEGIGTPSDAAAHVNDLIARAAEEALGHAPARVTDLGCGVGGSVFHLAQRWSSAQCLGVTISSEQVRLARDHAQARGLSAQSKFLQSDFTLSATLPATLPRADLVLAVESHVHAPDAQTFLQAALRHLAPGGVLVLVDDMLARPESVLDKAQARRVAQFRRGWRLGHVPDGAGLVSQAQALGFAEVEIRDLTPMLRLNRWRDNALRLAGPVADRMGLAAVPLFGNMIGGNALTESYRAGVMCYTLLVLRAPARAVSVPLVETTEAVA